MVTKEERDEVKVIAEELLRMTAARRENNILVINELRIQEKRLKRILEIIDGTTC